MILLESLEALVKKLPSYDKGDKEVVVVLGKFFTLVSIFRESQKDELSKLETTNSLLSLLKFEEVNLFSHPLTGIKYRDDVTIVLLFEGGELTPAELAEEITELSSLHIEWNTADRSEMTDDKEKELKEQLAQLDEEIQDMVNGVRIFMMNFANNLATSIHGKKSKRSFKDRIKSLKKKI